MSIDESKTNYDRFNDIFKQVLKSKEESENEGLKQFYSNLKKKEVKIRKGYVNEIKEVCDDFTWFKENSQFNIDPETGFLKIEKESISKEKIFESEERMKNLVKCSRKITFPLDSLFLKIEEFNKERDAINNNCLSNCVKEIEQKSDNVLKSEVKKCLDLYFSNEKMKLEKIEIELNQLDSQFRSNI